ncbi:MAG: hypothetical protein EOO46_24310, partial [Flavobacterium sp.]
MTFLEDLFISDVDLGIGLQFENCKFSKKIILVNSQANGYDNNFSKDSVSLHFSKCVFEEQVIIKGPNTVFDRSINFDECHLKMGLFLENISIATESIYLKRSVIEKHFDIRRVEIKQGLTLSSTTVEAKARLENVFCHTIALLDSIFKEDLQVWAGYLQHGFTINNGEYHEDVKLMSTESPGSLFILGAIFHNSVIVTYQDKAAKISRGFRQIHLVEAEYRNGLYISGKADLFSEPAVLEKLVIRISPKLNGELVFRQLNITECHLEGYNSTANLVFEDLWIQRIKISNFINQSMLIFSGLKGRPYPITEQSGGENTNTISITSSNFGKAQFYRVDFESFDKILIHDTIVSEISTSN